MSILRSELGVGNLTAFTVWFQNPYGSLVNQGTLVDQVSNSNLKTLAVSKIIYLGHISKFVGVFKFVLFYFLRMCGQRALLQDYAVYEYYYY